MILILLFWGEVRISVCSDISYTTVSNFIFIASIVTNINESGIYDTLLCTVSWIPDFLKITDDTCVEYEIRNIFRRNIKTDDHSTFTLATALSNCVNFLRVPQQKGEMLCLL